MLRLVFLFSILFSTMIASRQSSASFSSTQSYKDEIVPDSYIVTLASRPNDLRNLDIEEQKALVIDLVKQLKSVYGFNVTFLYDSCLKGFAAKMDQDTAAALAQDDRIELIEPDRTVHLVAQKIPEGIDRIDADLSSTKSGDGKGTVTGVDIYIIDTGIQASHPDLNVVGGANFNTGNSFDDLNGHGTHVAGIAAAKDNSRHVVGVAPGANLYAVRVLNSEGKGTFSQVIAGVNWVTKRKKANPSRPMVANISLGAYVGTTKYNSLDIAIKNSIESGVIYAIAAGNEGKNAVNFSPAHVKEGLTVGSYDSSNNKWADFSNYGSTIDILAPGVNVLSTFKGSTVRYMSGTSMSTPHVAGAAALHLSTTPTTSPSKIRSILIQASQNPSPGTNPKIIGSPQRTTNKSVYVGNF